MKPFVRSAYNYDMSRVSRLLGTRNDEPSLTIQSQRDEADINNIVRKYGVTGMVNAPERLPLNTDFMDVFDFQSAMNVIRSAEESFNSLDARVRARFNNSPHLFVEFCSDKENLPELRKMGLAPPTKDDILTPDPAPKPNPDPNVPRETSSE